MDKKESIFIGIDLGTTNVKAVALTAGGKIVTSSSRPLSLINDKPNWFEQDSDQWWEKTAECIKDIVNHNPLRFQKSSLFGPYKEQQWPIKL